MIGPEALAVGNPPVKMRRFCDTSGSETDHLTGANTVSVWCLVSTSALPGGKCSAFQNSASLSYLFHTPPTPTPSHSLEVECFKLTVSFEHDS